MRGRLTRLSATAAVALALATVGVLLGVGSAQAAQPVVVGSCATSLQGVPGTPVALAPNAVVQPVVAVVRTLDPLNLITPGVSRAVAALPPIPVGTIPTGTGYITGGQIANQVSGALRTIPLLGPILDDVIGGVQQTLAVSCGITVQGVNSVVAPVQEGVAAVVADPAKPATGGQRPGDRPGGSPDTRPGAGVTPGGQQDTPPDQAGGVSLLPGYEPVGGYTPGDFSLYGVNAGNGLYNFGRVPLYDYANLPFTAAGTFAPSAGVRYGGSVPGYVPEFGILGADKPTADSVRTAGRAQAIPVVSAGRIAAPVLIAVLALSCVTAALVRSWALRRANVA